MNPKLTQLKNEVGALVDNLNIISDEISVLIQDINANSETGSPTISELNINIDNINSKIDSIIGTNDLPSYSELSDRITNRGKDLLLVADQADQFICISSDTFSRMVDVYAHLNSGGINNQLLDLLNVTLNTFADIRDYLLTRTSDLTIPEVTDTSNEINAFNDILSNNTLVFEETVQNFNKLSSESLVVLDTFQSILAVNVYVGIALSVSKKAEEELKLMANQPYEETIVEKPLVTEEETSLNILDNPLFHEDGIGSYHLTILKFLPQLFLNNQLFVGNLYEYTVLNKIDVIPIVPQIPDEFGKLSASEISVIPRIEPIALEPVFEMIAFFEDINLSDASLQSYYNEIIDPSITFEEFKELFNGEDYLIFKNKFVDGLSSTAISEYIENYKISLQYKMINSTFSQYRVNENNVNFNNIFIEDDSLFQGQNEKFHLYLNDFIKDEFHTYLGSLSCFTKKEQMKVDYKDLHVSDELKLRQQSGSIKIKQTKDGILTKNISNFNYSYKMYEDDIQIYYIEAIINDFKFVIKNGILTLVYNIKNEKTSNIEHIINEDRILFTEYKIDGYLTSGLEQEHSLELIGYNETNNKIDALKKEGLETVSNITISSVYDSDNDQYVLTKEILDVETTTSYISDDPVDRIANVITNIYRTELIEDRLDFPQARIRSIVSTLRHLGYRKILDDYIELTWNLNIPRPKRGD